MVWDQLVEAGRNLGRFTITDPNSYQNVYGGRSGEPPNQTRTTRPRAQNDTRPGDGGRPLSERTVTEYEWPAGGPSGSGGSGGGSGGGGGGVSIPGAGGAGAAISATTVSGGANGSLAESLAEIDAARASARQELDGLDAQFAEQRELLREEYRFAETQEEKARLAFMLGDLENQRSAAAQAIASGYEQTVAALESRAEQMRVAAQQEAQQVGDVYRDAQASLGGMQGDVSAAAAAAAEGLGVGAAGPSQAAADWIGLMAAAAPREQMLSQRLGASSAGEADWLAALGSLEGEAQQAGLWNDAMQMRNQGVTDHARLVEERIRQERAQWRDQLAQLQGMFTQRGFDLGDQDRSLQAQGGEMRFSAGESAAQRELQASMANQSAQLEAARANQQASLERARLNQSAARARSGGGGGGGRAPSPPDLFDVAEAMQLVYGAPEELQPVLEEVGRRDGLLPTPVERPARWVR